MPDEYLPPNKILFLQNLPESVTKDQLLSLFSQLVFSPLFVYFHSIFFTDTQIYTKFVLFLPNEILLSWNSWTKGVQVWQKMHYTITSWMERTRSRCVFFSFLLLPGNINLLIYNLRLHSPESNSFCCIISSFLLFSPVMLSDESLPIHNQEKS